MPAPKGTFYEFGKGPSEKGGSWDPDFADPIFLAKLERFLAAMARALRRQSQCGVRGCWHVWLVG